MHEYRHDLLVHACWMPRTRKLRGSSGLTFTAALTASSTTFVSSCLSMYSWTDMLLRIAPLLRAATVLALGADPLRWGTNLKAGPVINLCVIVAAGSY